MAYFGNEETYILYIYYIYIMYMLFTYILATSVRGLKLLVYEALSF